MKRIVLCPDGTWNRILDPDAVTNVVKLAQLVRTVASDRRVSAFWIVEALDVVEHVGLGLIPRPVHLARCSLGLQRREEALHRRIVPDVARVSAILTEPARSKLACALGLSEHGPEGGGGFVRFSTRIAAPA